MATKLKIIVFADDWGRHPSSCQRLVTPILGDCDFYWINTLGTRRPGLNITTLRRGTERVRQWLTPRTIHQFSHETPSVLTPWMLPSFHGRLTRKLNAHFLTHAINKYVGPPCELVLLTTLPIVADLVAENHFAASIYYCVDDFSEWPGLDKRSLLKLERKLMHHCDAIIAAGENLAKRLSKLGREATIISHGVDVEQWSQASKNCNTTFIEKLLHLPKPICLFWGLIDRRIDVDWIQKLNELIGNGTIALAGPLQAPDPRLFKCDRVRHIGQYRPDELPHLAAIASALIMPYANLPVTRAMQPLKLTEYLATGKQVVCRELPAIDSWRDCLHTANSAEQFARTTMEACVCPLSLEHRLGRERLIQESWENKSKSLLTIIHDTIKHKTYLKRNVFA